jgi:hypothetical protein
MIRIDTAHAITSGPRCFGSGTIRKELISCYGSPFAVETAHIKFKDSDLSARIYRSLFDVARQYRESIDVYGSKASIEWPLIEHEPLVMHRAKLPEPKIPKRVKTPDYAKRLPKPIQRFNPKTSLRVALCPEREFVILSVLEFASWRHSIPGSSLFSHGGAAQPASPLTI